MGYVKHEGVYPTTVKTVTEDVFGHGPVMYNAGWHYRAVCLQCLGTPDGWTGGPVRSSEDQAYADACSHLDFFDHEGVAHDDPRA